MPVAQVKGEGRGRGGVWGCGSDCAEGGARAEGAGGPAGLSLALPSGVPEGGRASDRAAQVKGQGA